MFVMFYKPNHKFKKKKKTFCGFSMGSNQYWAGRVYDLCIYFMTGTSEGSTESGFMEKPGIEPVSPGLQDIGLSPTPRWRFSGCQLKGYFRLLSYTLYCKNHHNLLSPILF